MTALEKAVELLNNFVEDEKKTLEMRMKINNQERILYESKKRYLQGVLELLATESQDNTLPHIVLK